eukprot:snap_masked-scaffold_4-processed-gene-8.14-mRNA-1 protein AED:0.07 eAED:0.11 QI:0/-1/0/1/-1/1/1/0/379
MVNDNVPVYTSNLQEKRGGECLFLIDMQVDFVGIIGEKNGQSSAGLPVEGAKDDAYKVAKFIEKKKLDLEEIYITMDTHEKYHIAHASFWLNNSLQRPAPFTEITSDQIVSRQELYKMKKTGNKVFYAPIAADPKYCKEYAKHLEGEGPLRRLRLEVPNQKKKVAKKADSEGFKLTIWPDHCIVGTANHALAPDVKSAIDDWKEALLEASLNKGGALLSREKSLCRAPTIYFKGTNSKTEHYSAFRAEKELDEDPKTKFNEQLFWQLHKHDVIYVAGEASSHCVNYSVRDFIKHYDELGNSAPGAQDPFLKKTKLVVLKDCMSPVIFCDAAQNKFFEFCANYNSYNAEMKNHRNIKRRGQKCGLTVEVRDVADFMPKGK